jgi:hypothetical protein
MNLRRLAAAAAALALPLLPVAAAHADARWSAPAVVPGAAGQTVPLVLTRAGNAVLVDGALGGPDAPAGTEGAPSVLVPLAGDGSLRGTVHALPLVAADVATYGGDRIVVAGDTLDAQGRFSDRSRVQVGFGSAGGDLGRLRGLPGSTGEHVFAMAADKAGDVALVTGDTHRRRVWVRGHGGGATFRLRLTIPVSNRGRGATVAVGAGGDVLVAWEDQHHVYARHVGPGGGVGRTTRVGDGVQSRLQAAVGNDRRLMVAWASQRVDEGEAATPAQVFFATAAPGRGFGRAQEVDGSDATGTGLYVSDPAVRLVVGDDGTTLLADTGYDAAAGRFRVLVRRVSEGRLGAAQVVSDPARDSVLGDLAVGADGAAVVVWRTGIRGADPSLGTPSVQAAASPAPGRPFGAPETVTGADLVVPVAPTAALGSARGHALVAIPSLGQTTSQLSLSARAPIAP